MPPGSDPRPVTPARPCNTVQPGATSGNRTQPATRFDETNPIFSADPSPAPWARRAVSHAIESVLRASPIATRSACNPMQPGATARNATQPNRATCETNPIPTDDRFDPRQLAAARLLASGRSTPDVARELNLNRTTVWRWQRDPAFRAELRRIHERMITPGTRR